MGVKTKRRQPAKAKRRCLHCRRSAVARGICHFCRRKIKAAVEAGKLTDAVAVEQGLMLAAKPGVRPGSAEPSKIEQLIRQIEKKPSR